MPKRNHRCRPIRENYIRIEAEHFRRNRARMIGIAPDPTIVQLEAVPLGPPEFLHRPPQRRYARLPFQIVGNAHHDGDPSHAILLLCRYTRPQSQRLQ